MYRIGKTFRFEAAHYLPNHDGPCRTLHGHSYQLEVVIEGDQLIAQGPKEGMLLDYADLKEVVQPIIDRFDHAGLVQERLQAIPALPSTAEVIAQRVYFWLEPNFRATVALLHSVRVKETESTFAEFIHDNCPFK